MNEYLTKEEGEKTGEEKKIYFVPFCICLFCYHVSMNMSITMFIILDKKYLARNST